MSEDSEMMSRAVYVLTIVMLAVSVWAIAKYVSIPAGLGVAVYLLKPNWSNR